MGWLTFDEINKITEKHFCEPFSKMVIPEISIKINGVEFANPTIPLVDCFKKAIKVEKR